MPIMEPWQSWLAVVVGGLAVYFYYSTQAKKKEPPQKNPAQRRRDDVSTKTKPEVDLRDSKNLPDPQSSDAGNGKERNKRRKAAKKVVAQQKPVPAAETPGPSGVAANGGNEDEGGKEWASQLAALQKGSPITPASKSNAPPKTVARSGASISGTSSTTGADADDDLSPTLSAALDDPAFAVPTAKDVSDMLGPAATGPAVLRVTESTQPKPKKAAKQQQPTALPETKKQRQHRKKAEEQRLLREEQEKDRKIMMENQRRTAREARGEPARNGMQSARVPDSNPWSSAPNGSTQSIPSTSLNEAPLLDTFEPDRVSTASSNGAVTSGASASTMATNWADLPSEEEQMRMAMEETGWSTVPKGRKGKKKPTTTTEAATGNDSSDAGAPQHDTSFQEKTTPKPVASAETNGGNISSVHDHVAHPQDSDWAVV